MTGGRPPAQPASSDSDAWQRNLFAAYPHPMWVYDLETLRFLAVNDASVARYGYSREQFLQMTLADIRPTEDMPRLLDTIRSMPPGISDSGIWRHRTQDGSVIEVEIVSHIINFGARQARLVSVRDVTALRASEERYRELFNYAPDGIVIADSESYYLDANASICQMLGYTRDEIIGMHAADIVAPTEIQNIGPAMRAIKSQPDYHREWQFRRKDGSVFLADVIATQMSDGNLLGMIRDITARRQAEDALRKSQASLEAAQARVHIGSWEIIPQTQAGTWSREMYRIFQRDTALGMPPFAEFLDMAHVDDRPLIEAANIKALKGGEMVRVDFRTNPERLPLRYLTATFESVHQVNGRTVLMAGTTQDITERKRAEEHVQQLNRTYVVLSAINQLIVRESEVQAILDQSCRIAVDKGGFLMAWIGIKDLPTGSFKLTAHAGATSDTLEVLNDIFGDPKIGCAFTARALQPSIQSVCNDIEHDPLTLAWREAALQRGYRAMASFPLMVGERCVGTFNLYADHTGFFDPEELRLLDELARDIGFALAISERERQRQRALEKLLTSEERFRELAETIQDVFWITDVTGQQVLYVSPAYETIWQRTCQSLYDEPRTWLDCLHADDKERLIGAIAGRGTGGYDEEYRIIRADGEVRWIRNRAFPVCNAAGQIDRMVGVARDITERHALQQQLVQSQKMQAIGTLAGGIAHDFNNLLAAIIGNAELARQDLVGGHPALISIEEIVRAGQRAKELVQRILTFSRPHEQQLKPIHLESVIEEALQLLRSTLPAGVELHFDTAANIPSVRADASQIHQIILNLATNAWHAMESHGGRININLEVCRVDGALCQSHPELQPGPHVRLSVSDTGKGMDAAILSRIFEPFFTTKRAGQGVGLGLSMVHGILRGHGGAVIVESQLGKGSTFHLYFPVNAIEAGALLPAPTTARKVRGNGEHILYLDDEEPLVYLAVRFLERIGYRVDGYTRSEEALAAFRANPQDFDLVITDYNMPGMSGMEVAQQLMRIQPNVLVVLASGYVRPSEVEQARVLGIREIILKPNTIEELGPVVQRLLSDRSAARK